MSQADIINYFILTNNKPSKKTEIMKRLKGNSQQSIDRSLNKMGEIEALLSGSYERLYKLKDRYYEMLK